MQKPEVVAPGILMSSYADTQCGIGTMSGTSMSAPVVSGLSLAIRQWLEEDHPEWEKVLSGSIKSVLYLSSVPIKSRESIQSTAPYTQQGFGKVGLRDWSKVSVMQFENTPFSFACTTSGEVVFAMSEEPSLIEDSIHVNYLAVCENNEVCVTSRNHFMVFEVNAGDTYHVMSLKTDKQMHDVSVGLYNANCHVIPFEDFNASLVESIKYQDGSPYFYFQEKDRSENSTTAILAGIGSAFVLIIIATTWIRVLEYQKEKEKGMNTTNATAANATAAPRNPHRIEEVERFTFIFVVTCMLIILFVLILIRRKRQRSGYKVTAENADQNIELITDQKIHIIEETYEYE